MMGRRSALYRRLDLAGPLVAVQAGDVDLGDYVESVRITRGGRDLAGHSPATAQVRTPANLGTSGQSRAVSVDLDHDAAATLAAATYTTPATIRRRFAGRLATQEAPDRSNRLGGRRGTDLVAAAWSSLYAHSPDTWTPWNGATLSAAAAVLLAPSWEPNATPAWDVGSSGDTWPTADHDPITAADLLGILTGRLYFLHDLRSGALRIRSLERVETVSAAAGVDAWPLARAHCLAPTRWAQTSAYPTQYRLTHATPTGTAVIITGETPDGTTRVQDLDWTDLLVSRTEQWRRVYGLRFDTFTWPWRLPSLTVRLDHLIASPHEGHRRAAGMLLGLEVSDPVPLSGDWPTALAGVHIVTGIEEELTPHAWTMRLSLAPYGSLAGLDTPPVTPRTWAQAGPRTWADAGSRTWTQGVTP